MLRMFRHADGSLALFNGMGVTAPDALATVLAYDDARAQADLNAPHSGYQRLEGDDLVLIMRRRARRRLRDFSQRRPRGRAVVRTVRARAPRSSSIAARRARAAPCAKRRASPPRIRP